MLQQYFIKYFRYINYMLTHSVYTVPFYTYTVIIHAVLDLGWSVWAKCAFHLLHSCHIDIKVLKYVFGSEKGCDA